MESQWQPEDELPQGDEPMPADELQELLASDPEYLTWLDSLTYKD